MARHGSKLFFVISDLAKVNNMYQFSLAAFLRLFQRNLERADVSQREKNQTRLDFFCFLIDPMYLAECKSENSTRVVVVVMVI